MICTTKKYINNSKIAFDTGYKLYTLTKFFDMTYITQMYYCYKFFHKLKEYKNKSRSNKMDATNEVISSLKFIGNLKKGDKINTKFMYTQPDGVWTRFNRTFINPDNRNNTLNFVQRTISNAFDLIQTYSMSDKTSDKKTTENIIDDLMDAKNGLTNIKETYSGDLKFKCDISTLLQTIDSRLEDIVLKNPSIKNKIKQEKSLQIINSKKDKLNKKDI